MKILDDLAASALVAYVLSFFIAVSLYVPEITMQLFFQVFAFVTVATTITLFNTYLKLRKQCINLKER